MVARTGSGWWSPASCGLALVRHVLVLVLVRVDDGAFCLDEYQRTGPETGGNQAWTHELEELGHGVVVLVRG